jgi:hypothetical protein
VLGVITNFASDDADTGWQGRMGRGMMGGYGYGMGPGMMGGMRGLRFKVMRNCSLFCLADRIQIHRQHPCHQPNARNTCVPESLRAMRGTERIRQSQQVAAAEAQSP